MSRAVDALFARPPIGCGSAEPKISTCDEDRGRTGAAVLFSSMVTGVVSPDRRRHITDNAGLAIA